MKKEITCRHCDGSGKEEISVCDICKEESPTGVYRGKEICQPCWAKQLTDEEIENL